MLSRLLLVLALLLPLAPARAGTPFGDRNPGVAALVPRPAAPVLVALAPQLVPPGECDISTPPDPNWELNCPPETIPNLACVEACLLEWHATVDAQMAIINAVLNAQCAAHRLCLKDAQEFYEECLRLCPTGPSGPPCRADCGMYYRWEREECDRARQDAVDAAYAARDALVASANATLEACLVQCCEWE